VIPFTATERRMTVSVYSPDAGIPVRLKVEVHGQPTKSVETETLTTVANAWEDIVFNFDNPATGTAAFDPTYPYDMASIFFNFGTDGATAGSKTYYWDDVKFGATVGIDNPLASQVHFFPNPVSYILTVQLPEALTVESLSYKILDMTGRNILNGTLEKGQINVASLLKGMYVLQFQTNNGTITKRFVKM
jgi:Secretion system C-terminal sorting domain